MALGKWPVCRNGIYSIDFIHTAVSCVASEDWDCGDYSDGIPPLLLEQNGGTEQTIETEMGILELIIGTRG